MQTETNQHQDKYNNFVPELQEFYDLSPFTLTVSTKQFPGNTPLRSSDQNSINLNGISDDENKLGPKRNMFR